MSEIVKKMLIFNEKFKGCYSYLSNKREVTLNDFEKFHPPQKNPPSMSTDFLDFSHPPLLVY